MSSDKFRRTCHVAGTCRATSFFSKGTCYLGQGFVGFRGLSKESSGRRKRGIIVRQNQTDILLYSFSFSEEVHSYSHIL